MRLNTDFAADLRYIIDGGEYYVSSTDLIAILEASVNFHLRNGQDSRAREDRCIIEIVEQFKRKVISQSN